MSLRRRLERVEWLRLKRRTSEPRICPACGKAAPAFAGYMQGEGWSDVEEACPACLPENRVVITLVGVTERPLL